AEIGKKDLFPAQGDANVSRHTAREINDLIGDLVATWLQVILPEMIDFLGYPGQCLLPAFFHLVDRATAVRTENVRKPVDLNLIDPVFDGALDHQGSALDLFLL